MDVNRNIAGLTFGNTSAFGYTIGATTGVTPLLLSNGGVIQNLAGTGNHTNAVAAPLIIQGNSGTATFTANATSGTSLLTVGAAASSPISGVSTAGNTTILTLNGTNTAIGNVAGIVTNGTAGGKLAIVKNGTGTWSLGFASNASTFSGGITINTGTLRAAVSSGGQALGSGNAITLANTSGATLEVNNLAQTIGSLAGGGTSGGSVNTGGASGVLTIGLDHTSTSYAGVISGAGGITKIGTGTQTFSGTNTYTGATRLNGGTLVLDFSGGTAPATNIAATTSVLHLGGGTLSLTGKASTTNSQGFASTTLTGGNASALNLTADVTANSLLLSLGAITRNAGATLNLTLPAGTQGATHGIRTTTTNTRNNIFTTGSDIAYTTIGGTTWAGLSGGNLVPFTDAGGSYSSGTANYLTTNNVDVTDGDSVSGVTVNTLRFNGNRELVLAGTNTVSTGGILVTSAATTEAKITGGTLRSSGTADALQFINNGTQLTVSSVIADNGVDPTAITLAGPGTTTLSGENTYTGATYLTGGTVKVGHAAALGAASAVTIADKTSAILDLNGFDLSIASLAGGGGQGTLGQATIGTSGGTVAIGTKTLTVGDATNTVFGGTITGTGGSLVKIGSGTLTLNGANTLTGGITVKAGVLAASGPIGNNALGSGTLTLGDSAGGSASATLRVGSTLSLVGAYVYSNAIVVAPNTTGILDINSSSSSGSMTFTGGISGANNLRINNTATGGGSLNFTTNPINHSGTLTIGGSTINTNIGISGGIGPNVSDLILIRANGTATNGITISVSAVNNSGTISNIGTTGAFATISAPIGTNVTGINQNSATSILTLSGANTFRSPITVSSGTLILGGAQSGGITSAVTLANVVGATLAVSTTSANLGSLAGGGTSGGNVTLNNVGTSTLTIGNDHTSTTYAGAIGGTSPTITLRKIGTGTLTLSSASTYNGTTTALNGNLLLDYASVDPQGANALSLGGGKITFKGNVGGSTTDTVGGVTTIANSRSTLAVQNNAVITTGAWTSGGSSNSVLVDRSSGTTSTLKTSSAFATADSASAEAMELNDIVMLGTAALGSKRANVYVKDTTGIGFATQNASNEIVRYTGATTLDAGTATTNTTNYKLNANLTRTADLNFQTLDINTSGGAVTLNLGANALSATASGRGILVTGDNDASITGSATISGSDYLTVANYGGGTTTLGMNLGSSNGFVKNGTGLVVYSGTTVPGETLVGEGTLRFSEAFNYSTNVVRIFGGGIFEIGADLNGGTAGDFSKAVANSGNAVALFGDGGFSARGADRVVNLGGAAAALTWGASNFLNDGSTDNDYIFKLGSATSTHTLDFVNPIALGVRQRFVEVADGTSSTNVDGKLSGALSGTGGLTKTGPGTLALSATNTYTGPTTVAGGTLLVNGNQSASTGKFTINTGATLGGSGTVGGATTIQSGGTLAPGNSPGIQTFASGLILSTGSTFNWELTANTTSGRGTSFDGVDVTGGTLLVDTGVGFNIFLNSGSVDFSLPFWDSNQSWFLFDNANLPTVNDPSIFTLGPISNDSLGAHFAITGGSFSFAQAGNDLYLHYTTAVPEPSTYAIIILGLSGLLLARQRRTNAVKS